MILVTGGSGLLGSQLLYDLTLEGHKVRALKRKNSDLTGIQRLFKGFPEQWKLIEWIDGDLTDIFSLEDAMEGIDTVYHSAAMISFRPEDKRLLFKINVEGTANMVNIALEKQVKRFCHVSSIAALGRSESNKTIDENQAWKTSKYNSNYAISKHRGEMEVWRGIEEGLNAFIINPSIILGPGNWKTGSAQLFTAVQNGIPFYSSGITGYVDVRDVSQCAIALMKKNSSGERFLINSENLSYRELFFMIADEMKKKRPQIEVKPWMAAAVWRLERVLRFLGKKSSMITRETARNAMEKWYYNNSKVTGILQKDFIPIRQSVGYAVKFFLEATSTSAQ